MKSSLKTIGILAFGLWCCSLSAQTTTNLLDSFNRDGALAGSAPDFTENTGDAWLGTTWNTTSTGGGTLTAINAGFTSLSFYPADGHVYTLSVTQRIAGAADNNDRWGAVGFDDGQMNAAFTGHGPWMLIKQGGSLESYYNGGPGGIGGPGTALASGSFGFGAGTNNLLQIALDTTTPGSWKASVFVNGIKRGNTATLPSGFYISRVFISAYGAVSVTNTGFSVTSVQPTAPTISGPPLGFTNWAGVNGTLSVAASGSQPLNYQWYKNNLGNPLSGQTSESLSFYPLQGTDSGDYYVIVTNSFGSETSAVASVSVETGSTMQLTPSIAVHAVPGFGSDAASGIDSASNYLCALNFTTSGTPLDINGVTFQPVNASGNGPLSGADSVNGGTWGLSRTAILGKPFQTVPANVGGEADGAMQTLLTEAVGLQPPSVVAGDTMTLTFSNLIATGVYSIRVYYQQFDSPSLPVTFRFNGEGADEEVFLDENLGYSQNSYGAYYVEYDFTAVTNSASVALVTFSEATGTPHIYGATLLQVSAPEVAPLITSQPQSITNWVGYSNTLSVVASGPLPLHYQWLKNGAEVAGANTSALDFYPLTGTDSGPYQVIITNSFGSVTSSIANVLVITNGIWTYTPTVSAVQIPSINSDFSAGIETSNQYLCALDFGGLVDPLSINGVPFSQVNTVGAGTGTDTDPEFSGVDENYGGSWTLTAHNSGAGGIASLDFDYPGTVGSQADGSMQLLLTDVLFLGGAPQVGDSMTLTLGGLTPSATYDLRFYYRMWDGNRPLDFTFNGQGTAETVRIDEDSGGANYLNYGFTASGTNVSLTATVVAPNRLPIFYGVTLAQTGEAVPVVPVLHVSFSGSNLTISWDSSISGYTLESSDTLPGTNWTPVSGVVNNSVTVDTSTGTRFFRLRK